MNKQAYSITSKSKIRQSNLELLRILSMMLVMLVHYLPLRIPTDIIMLSSTPLKAIMNLELNSIAIVCVHCFILISGYFGIKWKLKSFLSLIFQLIFWALAGYLIAKYILDPYFPSNHKLNVNSFLSSMIDWYQARWFVSAYITLYIISPLINRFVENSSAHQLSVYILVFYIYSTIYGYIIGSKEFATGLSAISLIGLYMIGTWLRKANLKFLTWNKTFDILGFVSCTLVLTFLSFLLIKIGINKSLFGYLNPIVILESVFLFQFFRKLDIGHIKWINLLAAGAFSAFLLHCHPYLGDYCNRLWRYINESYDFALIYILVSITIIYIVAITIDKFRDYLWQLIVLIYNLLPPPPVTYAKNYSIKTNDTDLFYSNLCIIH